MQKNFSSENRALCERNRQKRGRPRQDTDENIIRRMRVACWIKKARDLQLEYVTRLVLHSNKGNTMSLNVKFLRTLPLW
jgi:predicted glycosyltransferase